VVLLALLVLLVVMFGVAEKLGASSAVLHVLNLARFVFGGAVVILAWRLFVIGTPPESPQARCCDCGTPSGHGHAWDCPRPGAKGRML